MDEFKSVQKSVRLTPRVYKLVDEYRGDGFNEKLANLIEDFIERREMLVLDWNKLQAEIADKRVELREIRDRVQRAKEVERRLGALIDAVTPLLPKD